MKKSVILAVAIVCNIGYSSAFAAGGWYGGIYINLLGAHGDYYLIDTNSTLINCGFAGRFIIKGDTAMAKQMYSTALAAFLGGKKINFYVDGTQGCVGDGMVITRIGIYN